MENFLDTISNDLSRFDARAVVDILLIAAIIYWVLLLMRGTTAMSVLRGIAFVFIGVFVLARVFDLSVLNYLLSSLLRRRPYRNPHRLPAGAAKGSRAVGQDQTRLARQARL